jgi:polyhydroxyalkanoate synthesis regulator phasin
MFSDDMQNEYFEAKLFEYFSLIRGEIEEKANSIISEKGELTHDDTKKITSNIIKKHYEGWKNFEFAPSISESFINEIIEKHKSFMDKSIKEIFEKLPISKRQLGQLKETAASIFSKFYIIANDVSGVVIAGFGENDVFPSLKAYAIEGIVENRLKYKEIDSTEIGSVTEASISPFAQTEMVETFMEGVDPSYRDIEENYLNEIFNDYTDIVTEHMIKSDNKNKQKIKKKLQKISKEIVIDYNEKLKNYRAEKYTDPITSVVSMLPKDELATMAETLVSLTSFKRKVSFQTESVGGPIDVAVISKGDGFIWIKRKHYFKQELNPQFFANYNKEEIENGKE